MTKLRILSDLHLEFGPLEITPVGEDVLILAGDIGVYNDGAVWARNYARRHDIPTVMIAGNHEYYRNRKHTSHTIESTQEALRNIADSEPLLHYLENDSVQISDILYHGCTLWTDFNLHFIPDLAMFRAEQSMNDYRQIYRKGSNDFDPEDTLAYHRASRSWLEGALKHPQVKQVVITHHLPSSLSLDTRYDERFDPAYASNLESLIDSSGVPLWIHGHTHVSQDYNIFSTRVVCNPRGYTPNHLNPDFNPDLIVEI